jgi:uncharacterized protein with von Willebrand factor type A (vWA) domain
MDDQLVRFIAHLRSAGVRISLAESQDAARALAQLPEMDPEWFRTALEATLVKEHTDQPIFDRLFPLYFFNPVATAFRFPEQALTPDQQQRLEEAMRGRTHPLLQKLASGQVPTPHELAYYAQQAMSRAHYTWQAISEPMSGLGDQPGSVGDMLRQMGLPLWAVLTGQVIQLIKQPPPGGSSALLDATDLMQRSFNRLSEAEARALRQQVRRLAAKLRSRAALRQRKGQGKTLDAKATLRANLRTGGIPFHLHFKKKRLKPKFTVICDVSTSMRPVAEFMLRLIYDIQDQTTKVRSFAFNDHLEEVSDEFVGRRPDEAIPRILRRIPPGFYATNLGQSLADFHEHFLDAVDYRTVVIFLGDGRNNGNNPRLDLFEQIKRRARRVVWLNPEPRGVWGMGDSDMLRYEPLCDTAQQVSNLAELTEAVDRFFPIR